MILDIYEPSEKPSRDYTLTFLLIATISILLFCVGTLLGSFLFDVAAFLKSDFTWSTMTFLSEQPKLFQSLLASTEPGELMNVTAPYPWPTVPDHVLYPYYLGIGFILLGLILGWKASAPYPAIYLEFVPPVYEDQAAIRHAQSELDDDGIAIHPDVNIGRKLERRGILYVGQPSEGKTQMLHRIIQGAIDNGDQAIIHDNKGELTENYGHLNQVGIIAPWDQRTWAWDISADVQGQFEAESLADQLTPAERDVQDPMWSRASAAMIAGAIRAMEHEHGIGDWNWDDVFDILDRPPQEHLKAVTEYYRPAEKIMAYGSSGSGGREKGDGAGKGRTLQSILLNTESYLRPFQRMAKAFREVPVEKMISIKDWLEGNTDAPNILILQTSGQYEELSKRTIQSVVSVIARAAASPHLPEKDHETWIILDEFPQLGQIRQIGEIWETGRSKGIRGVIAIQALAQLEETYSETFARKLQTMIETWCITSCSGSAPKRFSDMLGKQRVKRYHRSTSNSDGQVASITEEWRKDDISTIPPEFIKNKLGTKDNGVHAIMDTNSEAIYKLIWPYVNPGKNCARVKSAEWFEPSLQSGESQTRNSDKVEVNSLNGMATENENCKEYYEDNNHSNDEPSNSDDPDNVSKTLDNDPIFGSNKKE
jgi:hypothetical protein